LQRRLEVAFGVDQEIRRNDDLVVVLKSFHDLDAAIELASRIPAARMGGAVEVRPVVEW